MDSEESDKIKEMKEEMVKEVIKEVDKEEQLQENVHEKFPPMPWPSISVVQIRGHKLLADDADSADSVINALT